MAQTELIEKILDERYKQDSKWGEQNHTHLKWLAILVEEVGEIGECVNEIFPANKSETGCLSQFKTLKKEIIQTAAVCIAWLENIERRNYDRP